MTVCRSIAQGYRRCHRDRRAEYALTSVKRLEKRLEYLEDTGADDATFAASAARYEDAVNRLVEREANRADDHSAYGPPAPSAADDYTPATVTDMEDGDYYQTQRMVWGHDPRAAYSLALADSNASLDDDLTFAEDEPDGTDVDALPEPTEHDEIGALAGNLSRDEYAREEWETYVMQSYFDAEEKTGGALLNRRAREAGIDVFSLFSGSAERASKYASDELKAYWQENGRHTAASHRYMILKRPSDKDAHEYAMTQARFDDAAAVL
jgi:hypothetical protein